MPKTNSKLSGWQYWLVRDQDDNPVELVRCNPVASIAIAGEGVGTTQHKSTKYFTPENKLDLNQPVTFELIHAGDASCPAVGKAIDQVQAHLYFKQQRATKRKQYTVEDAKSKTLALLEQGSSIREAARLCGVPKSTVYDWAQ